MVGRSKLQWIMRGLVIGAVGFVFGCGQDVCFMNVGSCDGVNVNRNNNNPNGTGTATLTLTATPSATVRVASAVTLTTSGGFPPYTYAITNDSLPIRSGFQPIVPGDSSKVSFDVPPNSPVGTAKVRVTDSKQNTSNVLPITVTP